MALHYYRFTGEAGRGRIQRVGFDAVEVRGLFGNNVPSLPSQARPPFWPRRVCAPCDGLSTAPHSMSGSRGCREGAS